MPTLELPEIRATSPTLAETMRACLLRAGFSRARGSSNFVLGNPKAWLCTAYHEVLAKIVGVALGQDTYEAGDDYVGTALWKQLSNDCGTRQSQGSSSAPVSRCSTAALVRRQRGLGITSPMPACYSEPESSLVQRRR